MAINCASKNGHVQVLEWFKDSSYGFRYDRNVLKTKFIKILKFFSNINIKKLMKWIKYNKSKKSKIYIKTIKFKTRNKYLKGYLKN